MKIIVISFILLVMTVPAWGQMSDKAELQQLDQNRALNMATSSPLSLLDFSRIKWSNSYSVSFFSGGAGSILIICILRMKIRDECSCECGSKSQEH